MSEYAIDKINLFESPDSTVPVTLKLRDSDAQEKLDNLTMDILNVIYPVGSIYITRDRNFDPNAANWPGLWARITNCFIYSGDPNADTDESYNNIDIYNKDEMGTTLKDILLGDNKELKEDEDTRGGSNEYTLTKEQMPVHSHKLNDPGHQHLLITAGVSGYASGNYINGMSKTNSDIDESKMPQGLGGEPTPKWPRTAIGFTGIGCENAGEGKPINNMPKHIVRYAWERIATNKNI